MLALALLAVAPAALARWYQVEVVVFRQPPSSAADAPWPALAGRPDYGNSVPLAPHTPAAGTAAAGAAPLPFVPLARTERQLDGVARRLQGGGYELLLASAWRQPSYGVTGAKRVYLSDASDDAAVRVGPGGVVAARSARVEGTVRVKIARLMQVEVDFVYDHGGTPVRLAQSRALKLREIHYFDHPLFGVVVQVSPFELPEVAATSEVGADEPQDEAAEAAAGAANGAAPPLAD